MAPTEMIQVGLSLRSPRPTTPPSTPPTLSDEDASEILAAMKMHPTTPNPHCYRSELLPFIRAFSDRNIGSLQVRYCNELKDRDSESDDE